jgi:D-alanyl-D-alanine dipeptidase
MKRKTVIIILSLLCIVGLTGISLLLWGNNHDEQYAGRQNEEQNEEKRTNNGNLEDTGGEEQVEEESLKQPEWYEEGAFELPIYGAGGYTSVETAIYTSATNESTLIEYLPIGTPFMILEEQGNWWRIQTEELEGWIDNTLAMINLPDVIPSIIYDNPNNYGSIFRSSYIDIPNITGEKLYDGYGMNERLEKEEFIMPIIYSTAKKIAMAQESALENGETLVIKETFRPRSVQILINEELAALAESNEEVKRGITEEPWRMSWFISSGVSNHQKGLAVDLTLAQINESEERTIGEFKTLEITNYTEYEMYSPIFELSTDSAMLIRPISIRDRVGWQEIPYHDYVNEEAIRLESYMYHADMIPIPSEWWHFNDIDILEEFEVELENGDFYLTQLLNQLPDSSPIE